MKVSHEINREKTTTMWLTPPDLIKALGEFDLDPCSPVSRPWDTVKHHYTEIEDGLKQKWFGRVWCNPPYGPKSMPAFMEKMAKHGNGILLVFNRTETIQFHKWVWPCAHGILFKLGRIHFLTAKGNRGNNGSGCGSVFVAYGKQNAEILKNSDIPGHFIQLDPFDGL